MNSDNGQEFSPLAVEEMGSGIFREWYLERQLVAYRITSVTQSTAEAWANIVIKTIDEWPKDRPYLALHDLSAPGVALIYASLTNFDMVNIGVTPERRLDAEKYFNDNLQFNARVAVNFNLSFSGRMGKVLTSTFIDNHPAVLYKTFYNREKALGWLQNALDPSSV